MDVATLSVQPRDTSLKAKDLLNSGFVPIEYYGQGIENKSFQVDYEDFRRLYRKTGGNTVIEVTAGSDKYSVLVHNVDFNPVTDRISHVEFINVRMDVEVHTQIPITLIGTAPAVKELSGILVQNLNEIEIKCLPKDLIHSLEISVDALVDFHTALHVSDLDVPSAITVLNDPEELVAAVQAPRVQEEEETVVAGEEGEEGEEGAEGAEGVEGAEGEGGDAEKKEDEGSEG